MPICIFAKNKYFVKRIITLFFILISVVSSAQNDSISNQFNYGGNIGLTNNGISIIPTFSLNAPAFVTSISFSNGGKFSIDPDLRLTLDGRKGGAMLWFRYKVLKDSKFKLTVGAHPAYNFALKTITENGKTWEITQARRFWATEIVPALVINNHFALGLYYLNGHGLQDDGPTSTHFVTFSPAFTSLSLGGNYSFNVNPQVYYLKVDKEDGYYLSGNASISNNKSPLVIMGSYNKEIHTNITGSKNFDWNITLLYKFNNRYTKIK